MAAVSSACGVSSGGEETLDFFLLRARGFGTGEFSPSLSSRGLLATGCSAWVEPDLLGGCEGLLGLLLLPLLLLLRLLEVPGASSEAATGGGDTTFSFFESRLTIFFSEPISLLLRGWMAPPSGADGSLPFSSALLGFSGLVLDDTLEVGLGGGGLLGGAVFSDRGCFGGGSLLDMFSSMSGNVGTFDTLTLAAGESNRLLTLFGGGGRGLAGPCGVTPGFFSRPAGAVAAAVVGVVGVGAALATGSALTVLVRGETVFLTWGGGGRGMLGGGGIILLVGLFTFFMRALALGGGMGVPTGVSPPAAASFFRSGVVLVSADLADLVVGAVGVVGVAVGVVFSAAAAALAARSAGGTGGGGRRRGLALKLSMPVVRFLGAARCLLPRGGPGLVVGGATTGLGALTIGEVRGEVSFSFTSSTTSLLSSALSPLSPPEGSLSPTLLTAWGRVGVGWGEDLGVVAGLAPARGGGGASLRDLAGADCRLDFGAFGFSVTGGLACHTKIGQQIDQRS